MLPLESGLSENPSPFFLTPRVGQEQKLSLIFLRSLRILCVPIAIGIAVKPKTTLNFKQFKPLNC